MTTTTFPKRVFLLLVFSQVLWLAACEEEQEPLQKAILVQNITTPVVITQQDMEVMTDENNNNPFVRFRQEGDGLFAIDPEGLYLLCVFIPKTFAENAVQLVLDILAGNLISENVLDFGTAIAVAKVQNGTAERHILTFAGDDNSMFRYWNGFSEDGQGGVTDKHHAITLLLTPDARFILRSDFFCKGIEVDPMPDFLPFDITTSQYIFDYSGTTNRLPIFEASAIKSPQALLTDNIMEDFIGKFF
ncbi:MAG: hypothetical protein LBK61_01760 [Spirochaetaceae bacterium]|jgi:hypothetical protein|nr:hypothetical protein [Spirochaetaceae bacterium]